MTRKSILAAALLLVVGNGAAAQETPAPVIDMHIHALSGRGLSACLPIDVWPAWDPARPYRETYMQLMTPSCEDPVVTPETDEAQLDETLEVMGRRNVYGMLTGSPDRVATWVDAAPDRFFSGALLWIDREGREISPDSLRALHEAGRLDVLAEVANQYSGIAPADERMEPYWALAEELDLPVGIHIGISPPGVRYLGSPGYLARLHDPLTLEDVLVNHPNLRVYVMHAGYPMLEEMLTLMYVHPQVHVDVGAWITLGPRAAAERYIERMVEAGFSTRIMYGSDAQYWPGGIEYGIEIIEEAPFLTEQQKRDILYNNAARFLRLDEETIQRHHAGG